MSLTIYRRHSVACQVHKLNLQPRAKRFYTECDCGIWLKGKTDKNIYPRQSTGLVDWKAAEAYLRSLVAENKETVAHGLVLADCIKSSK